MGNAVTTDTSEPVEVLPTSAVGAKSSAIRKLSREKIARTTKSKQPSISVDKSIVPLTILRDCSSQTDDNRLAINGEYFYVYFVLLVSTVYYSLRALTHS